MDKHPQKNPTGIPNKRRNEEPVVLSKIGTHLKPIQDVSRSISYIANFRIPSLDSISCIIPEIITPPISNAFLESIKDLIDGSRLFSAQIEQYQPLFTQIAEEHKRSMEIFTKSISKSFLSDFSLITKNLHKYIQASFPPNWIYKGETQSISSTGLDMLLLDEGLALAYVPSNNVLDILLRAESASERRKILANNSKGIINDCIKQLENVNVSELRDYRHSALQAARALKDGYWQPSQALSANLIDSIIRQMFGPVLRSEITSHKKGKRINWRDFPIKDALVFGGVWGAYSEYRLGDGIPRQFTRHATAHAVSNRQYTKINSVIALMHTVSLILLLADIESQKQQDPS